MTQKFLMISSKKRLYNWMRKILYADQRQKQNHKEENLLALHQESFPWKEGIGAILNQGNISLSEYEISKKVTYLLRRSQKVHREEDGAVHFWRIKENLQNHSHNLFIGLTVDGKHVWQQEEERTQSYLSFIAGQCCDSEQILPIYLPYWMCVQSSFYHQLWINTWRSKFEQETDNILPAC